MNLQEFFQNLNTEDLALLTISVQARQPLVASYIEGNSYTFPILLDTEGEAAHSCTIANYPTTLLIDEEGKISRISEASFSSVEEIEEFIASDAEDANGPQ